MADFFSRLLVVPDVLMKADMFLICTISNKPSQYAEMKASLLKAGFDEQRCRYQVFDNSTENAHDPYRTINRVMGEATEPYVIFCHQDIVLDQGDGFDQLVSQLDHLSRIDPEWAVAGNAGCMVDMNWVVRISDPTGSYNAGGPPQKVCTLDENFLVLRTASGLRCSSTLSGFHLYATDLCLQAHLHGQSSYVLNFHLTHLSQGNPGSADFKKCLTEFKSRWNPHFFAFLVQTPSAFFTLSRSPAMRRWLASEKVTNWIKVHKREYRRIAKARWLLRKTLRRSRPAALPQTSPSVET